MLDNKDTSVINIVLPLRAYLTLGDAEGAGVWENT